MKKIMTDVAKAILDRNADLAQIITFQLNLGDKSYPELIELVAKAGFNESELSAGIGLLIKESRILPKDGKWSLIEK